MSSKKDTARLIGHISGVIWISIAFTQMVLGFVFLGQCEATSQLPIYTAMHGLINILYGIGIMLFIRLGYKRIIGRVVFYTMWFIQVPICFTGFGLYATTVIYLATCGKSCKTCGNYAFLNGSVATESLLFTIYFLLTMSFIAYECTTDCKHCHKNDDDNTPHARRIQVQHNDNNDPYNNQRNNVHIQNQFVAQNMNIPNGVLENI